MILPADDLQAIEDLRERNLNLQAFERAKKYGDFSDWQGTDAIVTASGLAFNVGAPEESSRLNSRAWHRDKTHPKAIFQYAIEILQHRGPLPALLFMRRFPDFKADAGLTSWWYSLGGQLHSLLRDFRAAERLHELAFEVAPDDGWAWTARAFTLENQDKYEEALELARKGLELDPTRRSCISAVAHYLTLLERNDEALDLLSKVVQQVENGWLLKELGDLQTELGLHGEAYTTYQRCVEFFPRLEKKSAEWLYGALSDGAYLAGDVDRAIEYAERASNPFHNKILEKMKAGAPDPKRVQLDVRFLRQHHVTCAPATISNIARYWEKKAEHLDLVEQMCYDGTPSYKERIWAEANGWVAKEFTLNWDDAKAMIDRGIPLTLATVYPGGGHLQAIIGYDSLRRTFLIRDPYFQRVTEFNADELIEEQIASGPRVMALVPNELSSKIVGLERPLAESEIYDLLFTAEAALDRHDRESAGVALTELETRFPGHRLTIVARWTISAYDANSLGIGSAIDALQKKFPDDVNLRMSQLSISYEFTGRAERIEALEKYSKAKPTDPLIWQMFGYELGLDAKQHRRSLHWLWKSLRKIPTNALNFRFIADVLWSRRRFDEAVELYGFAASLNDKDEQLAYTYFLAMWNRKREDEALEVLSDRAQRFGRRSGMPVRSLFAALRELGRVEEGLTALDQALAMRPDDGDLILFAADVKARYGRTEEADRLVQSAQGRAAKSSWFRGAAQVARLKGDLESAVGHWREVLKENPVDIQAHENVAFLLKGTEGAASAKEYLRRACRKYPTNRSLQVLRLQHLTEEPGEAIAVLRDLIRRDPGDVWSVRELARWYAQIGKLDQSLEMSDRAVEIAPHDSVSHQFRGQSLELLRRYEEAGEAYKKSIEFSVDSVSAISAWVGISRSMQAKKGVLDFVWNELRSQVSMGDGLFAYRDHARRVIDRPTLLNNLQEYAEANPRSWFAASAVIQQLWEMGRNEEALQLALKATQRFPLVHETWLDLSLVHQRVGNSEGEIEALRTAVAMNPVASYGVQQLAGAYQRAGRLEEAREVLVDALARLPFDNFLLGYLSEVYWGVGLRAEAIETAKRAVMIEPDYKWAWNAIKNWAEQIGDHGLPSSLARELTEKKPKDVQAWMNLADMLDTGAYSDERMAAIEEALKIDPFEPTALAMKANGLADARKFDEAIKVTHSKMSDGHRSEQLQFVEAGLEAMRGNMHRSEEILIRLTENSPSYLPGWIRLADIYRLDPDRAHEYRKTAMEITRLAPRDATSFGYLAEACLRLNLEEDAKEALQQAAILDPTYEYAVTELFDSLLRSNDLSAAEVLVTTIRSASPANGLPIEVELEAKRGDVPRLLASLRELLLNKDVPAERLARVFEKVTTTIEKGDKALLDLLSDVAADENANPVAGKYLIENAWAAGKKSRCEEALNSISSRPVTWSHAAARYMEEIAGGTGRALIKFIDANSEMLASEIESWGAVGYQLANADEGGRLINWFKGWEKREGVRPWMLWNLVFSLRKYGAPEEADKVSTAALALRPDDTINMHLTCLALRSVKRGDVDEAQALFSNINPHAMTNWDRFFYDSLHDSLFAYEYLKTGDAESAKLISTSIVDRVIEFDPKDSDKIVRDLVREPLSALFQAIGDKWFSFKMKAKLIYYSFG